MDDDSPRSVDEQAGYPDQMLFRGRMQPWANHYAEVIDTAAQTYGIDEVVIAVPQIEAGRRSPKNPFTGEERMAMIEDSYEHDFDVEYDVEVVLHERPLDEDLFDVLDDELLLYTRERKWDVAHRMLRRISSSTIVDTEIDVTAAYEPRGSDLDHDLVGEDDLAPSSTSIRQSIVGEDDTWRSYVPDSTETKIDLLYDDAVDAIERSEEQPRYASALKHVDQLVSLDWRSLPEQLRPRR